jgi:hypothetical protein
MTEYPAFLETMDEDDESGQEWGKGSQVGEAPNKARDIEGAHKRLIANYFNGAGSKYNENDFERRFRMPRFFFLPNLRSNKKTRERFVCPKQTQFFWEKGHPSSRPFNCLSL